MSCVAVIPARRAENTIAATLESLRIGNDSFVERVVVVTSADDPTARVVSDWSRRDPRVHLLAADRPLSAGAARNAGRAFAGRTPSIAPGSAEPGEGRRHSGLLLLFIDADCRLEKGGAARLGAELAGSGAAAVSARVLGEGGLVARSRHILEFKEAASARMPPPSWLPPSTTMMCRAEAFDRAGGFPDLWPGEDLVFSQVLRDLGEPVLRSEGVVTTHRHPGGIAEMLRHQYRLGRTAALARRARPMPGAFFANRPWLAMLLLPGRVVRITAWQAREGVVALAWSLLLSPLLLAGLAVWTAGFVAGGRAALPPVSPDADCSGKPPGKSFRARTIAVVPVFNGEGLLDECLDALLATDDDSLGIVVVDDGSRDGSLELAHARAARSDGRIRVLALDRNHGFAGAVNRGVAFVLAQGEEPRILALVNQDCFVSRGWLAPLARALEEPRVAVAGARLLDVDGLTLQHAGARIEANGLTTHLGRGCRDPLAWRTPREVDYVCGALLALRTATWRRLGPLDEGYTPAYFEEVDYCRRARHAGLRVLYVPDSEARHVEASCSGSLSRTFLTRYHRNRLRFVMRHQLGDVGALGWLRAEAAWLLGLRRWGEIAPVLAAYARTPLFLSERLAERATAGRTQRAHAAVVEVSR